MSEIAVYQPQPPAVPDRRDTDSWVIICSDVIKLANVIHDTEFVPDGLRGSAPAVAAAILAGREMGIGPMTSLQNIHMIKGKPTQSALLMRALVQSRGHKWEDVDVSDTRVVVRGCRAGESKWAEVTFTAAQAKIAGIDLGKYPQDKLYARASARLCRRKFADVVAGMPYTPDEVEDGEDAADQARTVTQVAVAENGAAPAKPAQRTAHRRQRAADRPTGAQAAAGLAEDTGRPAPAGAQTAPSATPTPAPSSDLPPLPGEEEADPTTPAATAAHGTSPPASTATGAGERSDRHKRLTGIVHQHFKRLGFGDDEREQRLATTAVLAGITADLDSSSDLTEEQLSTVADTLARCKDRDRLIALLAAGESDA